MQPNKLLLSLTFIATLGIAGSGYYYWCYSDAETRNEALRAELQNLRQRSTAATPSSPHTVTLVESPRSGESSSKATTSLPIKAAPAEKPKLPRSASVDQWLAAERIKEVDQFVVLDESQRQALSGEFVGKHFVDLDSPEMRRSITQAIGPEKADAFYAARENARAQQAQEHVDTALFGLSRRLGLSSAQEQQARSVILEVEQTTEGMAQTYRLNAEEVSARHNDQGNNRDSLRQAYQEMKVAADELQQVRGDLYRQKLKGILTEDQYNAYLANEAASPVN